MDSSTGILYDKSGIVFRKPEIKDGAGIYALVKRSKPLDVNCWIHLWLFTTRIRRYALCLAGGGRRRGSKEGCRHIHGQGASAKAMSIWSQMDRYHRYSFQRRIDPFVSIPRTDLKHIIAYIGLFHRRSL